MANQRIGEAGSSDSTRSNYHHHVPYATLHGINTSVSPSNQEGSTSDFGGLEDATVLQLQGLNIKNDEPKTSSLTVSNRPRATLELFPSSPSRFQPSPRELFLGGFGVAAGNISSGAAKFDREYARWLEADHRYISELKAGQNANLSDGDLRILVDGYISHYDKIFQLKSVAAKCDVFHLISGTWKTVAERCFLWIGGFRPSEVIKMLIWHLGSLIDVQLVAFYSLQQAAEEAEEVLSQGLEQLLQSLMETIAIDDTHEQMAVAFHKLAIIEDFATQADSLRQQTLHQLNGIMTAEQAARCFVVIGEFDGRLRALSSLWTSRPRHQNISL